MTNIYIIPGKPIPWARPRLARGIFFDSQSGYKRSVGTQLRMLHKDNDLFEGPLHIDIIFYMKHKKKRGWHSCRPDIDNMIKFYLDAANGILYGDDSCIAQITAQKVYDKENSVWIKITELIV